ncbi:MAG: prepilin-type N-terminal cleavage/methylation domain-containing protein [bacterium]|nr:prepilin-type N-terminal cleavage/methylation domain-containing protein [bacterium]
MDIQNYKKNAQGMSLIEILIGCSIIVIGILALSTTFTKYVTFALNNERTIQAAYLAEEGLEAVTFLREKGWTTYIATVSTSTPRYLAWDSTNLFWKATSTPQYIDGLFLRSFTVTDVRRNNTTEAISTSTSGTYYDPKTKSITVDVAYRQGIGTTTHTMTTYITNLNDN